LILNLPPGGLSKAAHDSFRSKNRRSQNGKPPEEQKITTDPVQTRAAYASGSLVLTLAPWVIAVCRAGHYADGIYSNNSR